MSTLDEWRTLCDRLHAKGAAIFDAADPGALDADPRDPPVVALTLLARALGHHRAAMRLLDEGFIVEARTLVRCVNEVFFFAAALARQGAAFVDALEQDAIGSRRRRAKGLLDWSKTRTETPDHLLELEALRDRLWSDHGPTASLQMTKVAEAGGVEGGLILYRELSTDAAHPSAASLSRNVSINEEATAFTLHALPLVDEDEPAETLELLCSSVLSVLVAVKEIVGGVDGGERLDVLAEGLKALGSLDPRRRE